MNQNRKTNGLEGSNLARVSGDVVHQDAASCLGAESVIELIPVYVY